MKVAWAPVCCVLFGVALPACPGEAVTGSPIIGHKQKGDFPGIHFVKPGSVLQNIVVPRYENHRLTARLKFASMEVLDRSHVLAKNLVAVMFDRNGGRTCIETETAVFSFLDDTVRSGVRTTISSDRFRAEGSDLTVQTKTHRGFLRGPVTMEMPALGKRRLEEQAPRSPVCPGEPAKSSPPAHAEAPVNPTDPPFPVTELP